MDSDYFRQKMPYGIERTDSGQWIALNRNYKVLQDQTLSFVDSQGFPKLKYHLGAVFLDLEETDLLMMACRPEAINRDKGGEIHQVFFYHDGINPSNSKSKNDWDRYFSRLKILSKFSTK